MIKLKTTAIAFSLKDQNSKIHDLTDYKGKRVVLSFRPLAWTPI
jgi:peroxiredoxin